MAPVSAFFSGLSGTETPTPTATPNPDSDKRSDARSHRNDRTYQQESCPAGARRI